MVQNAQTSSSEEKVVNVDVAKQKVKDASEKVVNKTTERVKDASEKVVSKTNAKLKEVSETVEAKKNSALAALVEKGIALTQKQMSFLEKIKEKAK